MSDAAARDPEPRFVADAMLGRLARWMRVLGFDVEYGRAARDAAICRQAVRESRVVLTRDHALLRRRLLRGAPGRLLVASDRLGQQLAQVIGAFGLVVDERRLFSRCAACNGLVLRSSADALRGRVPPYVLRTSPRLSQCSRCGKPYWEGTHRALALRHVRHLLGRSRGGGTPP